MCHLGAALVILSSGVLQIDPNIQTAQFSGAQEAAPHLPAQPRREGGSIKHSWLLSQHRGLSTLLPGHLGGGKATLETPQSH